MIESSHRGLDNGKGSLAFLLHMHTSLIYLSCILVLMSILGIYQYILVYILTQWITEEEVCHLDSAACSHADRKNLLNALEKCHLEHISLDSSNRNDSYKWMNLRGVGLKKIRCGNIPSSSVLQLTERTQRLQYLEVFASKECLDILIGLTTAVKSLRLYGNTSEDIVAGFIQFAGSQLVHLDLSECKGLSFDFISSIPALSLSLSELLAPSVINVTDLASSELTKLGGRIRISEEDKAYCSCELVHSDDNKTALQLSGKFFSVERLKLNFLDMTISATAVAQYCGNLLHLIVDGRLNDERQWTPLFKLAPLLRSFECGKLGKLDKTLEALSNHCQQLEVLKTFCVASENQVLKLLQSCLHLREMSFLTVFVSNKCLCFSARNFESLTMTYSSVKNTLRKETTHRLSSLVYTGSNWIDNTTLVSLFSQNSSMKKLAIECPCGLNSEGVQHLVETCRSLTSISILHCRDIPSSCLQIMSQCKHLSALTLRDMRKVTNTMIYDMLKDKPYFLKLALPHCGGISGGILRIIGKYCPLIRHVDVSYCEEVKSSDVIELLNACTALHHLDLKSCKQVSSDILTCIKPCQMSYFNVFGCNILKETVAKYVASTDIGPCQIVY